MVAKPTRLPEPQPLWNVSMYWLMLSLADRIKAPLPVEHGDSDHWAKNSEKEVEEYFYWFFAYEANQSQGARDHHDKRKRTKPVKAWKGIPFSKDLFTSREAPQPLAEEAGLSEVGSWKVGAKKPGFTCSGKFLCPMWLGSWKNVIFGLVFKAR